MVGGRSSLQEARGAPLQFLASHARDKNSADCDQIILDLQRNTRDMPEEGKKSLKTLLFAFVCLNKGIGYAQGMDVLAIVLRGHFVDIKSSYPDHDTLAALGFVCRVNAAFIPLHSNDPTPLQSASLFASEVWLEVTSMNPRVGNRLLPILDLLEMFAMKHLGICFANLFNKQTIRLVWSYLFREAETVSHSKALAVAARRSRHVASACILQHRKLWLMGKDTTQDFQIWESVLQVADRSAVERIVGVATHLEVLETAGGGG